MKKFFIIVTYLVLVLFTIAPILSVVAASIIARAYGVQLDEGSEHPCLVLGHDIGPSLYLMFVAGWFMLIALPVGFFAIMVFTFILSFRYICMRQHEHDPSA
jgi:hypothetical protein